MSEIYQTAQGQPYKDRSTGLMIFGILTALLGGLCALMVPLILFGTMAAPQSGDSAVPLRTILPSILLYIVMAVALISLGVGSCKARRWARALMLVSSWSWLIFGIIGVIATGFLMPRMLDMTATAGQAPMPEGAKIGIMIFAMAFYAAIFVALPAVWVFFYRSRHVKATCEARDPVPRWTDRCPLPVLAVVLWLALGTLTLLLMPLSVPVLPFFGDFLTGAPAAAGYAVLALIWAWCARGMYRLDGSAWWVLLVTIAVFMTSHVLTYLRHDITELYQLMGYSGAQLEAITPIAGAMKGWMIWGVAVFALPCLAYLIYIKRYFRPARAASAS